MAPLAVVAFEAANIGQVDMLAGARLVMLSLVVIVTIWALLALTTTWAIAAQCIAIPSMAFWFVHVPSVPWILFGILAVQEILVITRRIDIADVNRWANWTALIILSISMTTILTTGIPRDILHTRSHGIPSDDAPDIYLIVLDSYGGHSILQSRFGYNDGPFLGELERLGFATGECEQPGSNTKASLGATLNDGDATGSIRDSTVRSKLEQRGYHIVAFSTGFIWTEIRDADAYLSPPIKASELSEFEAAILLNTPLADLVDATAVYGDRYRDRTSFELETLPDLATWPEITFTFAHLIIPHPPFVFYADGSARDWSLLQFPGYTGEISSPPEYRSADYADGYIAQLAYIDKAIIPVIDQIIRKSSRPPVILLQGDHGPWYSDNNINARDALCAVYSPGRNLPVRAIDAFAALLSQSK